MSEEVSVLSDEEWDAICKKEEQSRRMRDAREAVIEAAKALAGDWTGYKLPKFPHSRSLVESVRALERAEGEQG